jgi:hypothetical protein
MAEPHLEHQSVKIRQLIEDYRMGHIVIPEFQRDYVWKKNKAPLLLDSLYRGFPISSLLLWQSTEETRARRRDPRPSRTALMNWLIDGQQRVTMLSKTQTGDEGIEVVFNPREEMPFRLANAATRNDRNWVRVADLWDDEQYRQLRRGLDGGSSADKREASFEKVRRILDYEVPLVRMVDHTFKDAVSSFKRINTLGVRLKQEDIESAKVAERHFGFIADEVAPFLRSVREQQGFKRLNIMHLFRACAFVAQPDGRNRTPLHELGRREVLSAWKDTKRGTEQAIGIVRGELGLVNMDILWSGSLVVPIIALCATQSPRHRDSKELIGWLALATLAHRYSGSSGTALDQDLRACRETDPIGGLLKNLRQDRPSLVAEPSDFAGALADRNGLLALYIACMHRGILDFYTGGRVLLQKDVHRHHILPRAQFPEGSRSAADNVANIAFIAGDVNQAIKSTGPEVYLKRIALRVLRSQCIPEDDSLWRIESATEFWAARRELLAASFNDFLIGSLPQRRLGNA